MSNMHDRSAVQRSLDTLILSYHRMHREPRPVFADVLTSGRSQRWRFSILMAVLVVSIMLLADGAVHDSVRKAMTANPTLKSGFQILTRLGSSGWILIVSAAIGLVLSVSNWQNLPSSQRQNRLRWYANANFVFFTVALSGTLASLIKNTIGRARPKWFDQFGTLHFDFAAFQSSFASFPSGHATTFGAFCMAMALLTPRIWPVWLGLALLGGFSRVAVGAHYLSDIVAGLTFGAAFVWLSARFLARRGVMFHANRSWLPRRRRYI